MIYMWVRDDDDDDGGVNVLICKTTILLEF